MSMMEKQSIAHAPRTARKGMAKEVGKKAACIALAAALAVPSVGLGVGQAFAAAGFPDADVVPGAWYVPYIEDAVASGIIHGFPDGTFAPEQAVTRAQVAIMLARAEGVDTESNDANATPWTDVADYEFYTNAMNWAYSQGIYQGYEGLVRPDDTITREEMATVVARYLSVCKGASVDATGLGWPAGDENTLGEELLTPYAVPTFKWLANEGIVGGIDNNDGTFSLDPQGTATRAMFAKVAVVSAEWEAPEVEAPAEKHATPSAVDVIDIAETSATVHAYDAAGNDITQACEFSLDGRKWQRSCVLTGLSADTEYTVSVRHVADKDGLASDAATYTFRTAATEEQPGGGDGDGGEENPGIDDMFIPVRVEVSDITPTSANIAGINKYGTEIWCEFSLDGKKWQENKTIIGLEPDTEYTVYVRVPASESSPASAIVSTTFRTLAEEIPEGSEKILVNEYDYFVHVKTYAPGLGINSDLIEDYVMNYRTNERTDLDPNAPAAYKALEDYLLDMASLDTPYNEGWDRVTNYVCYTTTELVKTGSHYEYVTTDEERQKLYSYNELFEPQPNTEMNITYCFEFYTADGQKFTSKKEAYRHGTISSVIPNSLGDPQKTTGRPSPAELIIAAGGDPSEAWCFTGERLETMDGIPSN